MKELENNPFPRGTIKLVGEEDVYRLRAGGYRILYRILWDKRAIIVFRIAPRERAYE